MVKVGFLGTGLMGQAMAQRLLEVKVPVVAHNRTRSKLEPLKEAGAEIANSAAEAIAASDCVILMLADAKAIEDVVLSESSRSSLADRTVIQMGTIAPRESQAIQEAVIAARGDYLEAPVLGSIPQAESGTLQVMVGASEEQFQKWSEVLKHLGSEPMLIGSVGTAAAVKLALNQLIASLTAAFALSLSFVQRQGVEVEQFMQILRESALYAPTFDKKLERMLGNSFENPNFPLKHLLKDANLFLGAAQDVGLNTSSLEGVRQVIEMAKESGLSDKDYSALFRAINE